ncbi:alkaline phosphatase family protein [Bdellovibrio bacteriovorus]|uniref:alkaline phosphatase family protein n=1 Tax=Bdellovibrio bacteriovorus TaxID=959 RepID=UPI0035A57D35
MIKIFFMSVVFLFTVLVRFEANAANVEHVVIVSIDGGKPTTMNKSRMPNLRKLVASGASTFNAKTIFPSKTLPSHVSMLTGVPPSMHKVTWNDWIPSKGEVKVPTIFGLAKAQGYSTAIFAAKEKFKHLEVKGTLDMFSIDGRLAVEIAENASRYLDSNLPNLMFVHLPDADVSGHAGGWDSPSQLKALEQVDIAIGILMQGISKSLAGKSYALILTGDHGGTGQNHGSPSPMDSTIPWIAWGTTAKVNTVLISPVSTMDTAATALWLMGVPVPSDFTGIPVVEAF